MNFLLNSEQHEMQRTVLRYLDERLDTLALHRSFDDEGDTQGFDATLWQGLAELGVLGVNLPEEDGGLGLEMIDLALVAECLGARAAPLPFLGHVLATLAISWAGSAEQKARWLPALIEGRLIASVGLSTGPNDWDPAQWTTPAAPAMSATWSLVPGAPVAQLFVLGAAGGELLVIERTAPGVTVSARASTDRTRRLGLVTLEHASVERLPQGPAQAERLRDAALVLLAADAFGGATRCHELAVSYAKEREQFGQPIGQFQAVKHQLADMVISVEPARGLYWYAAHGFDHCEPTERAHIAALAKAHLADAYVSAARRCVEVFGGMGYTWELDVHLYLRRAMFDHAYLGTPATWRARAAELAGW